MTKYKNALLLVISLLFISSFLMIFFLDKNTKNTEQFLIKMIEKDVLAHFNHILGIGKWNSSYEHIYAKKKDDADLMDVTPFFMIQEISKMSKESENFFYKVTSLHPINIKNIPDKFEKEALVFLEKNRDKKYYSSFSKDKTSLNFMGALTLEKSCLRCHVEKKYKLNELRGGIRITIPTSEYMQQIEDTKNKAKFLTTLIIFITIMFVCIFILFINKFKKNHLEVEGKLKEIEQLEKSNSELIVRFEYAMDGTKDGLWDWNLKTNEIYLSASWKSMLGYEDLEIKNSVDEWKVRIHPEDKEKALQDIQDNIDGKTKNYKNIHRLKHKDGSWVWILDRGKTYYDEEGNPSRMVGFHSDITELKKLELKLKKTQEELMEFRLVIESAPISIVITDINANIVYVNPHFCKVSGYSKDEIIGKNPRILKYNDEKQEKIKFRELWATILDKKSWGGILRNKNKNGDEYWETATILPILDKKGNIINFLGITREITKEIYLKKELDEKEELMIAQSRQAAMGEMISMIAHQWRQPITTISMLANNIIADIELKISDEDETKKTAENISKQTQFLSKTIDDFRNFFQKDKKKESATIKVILDELFTIMLASLKNSNVDIDVNYDEELIICTYRRELLQILLNLVKNAKEAFFDQDIKDKRIYISVKEDENKMIEIKVHDNAGGIKEEVLEKMFEAYFTTKNERNGTGLGLYMSRMIAQKHLDGSLDVYNEREGATFVLTFPNVTSSHEEI